MTKFLPSLSTILPETFGIDKTMTAPTPLFVFPASQKALIVFANQCFQSLETTWNLRQRMRDIDLSYLRQVDWTQETLRAKLANRIGDPTRLQNIIIPLVAPQVASAVAYQAAVFLSPKPIFEFLAPPENISEAKMFQAIVEENANHGGWIRQLLLFFYDIHKYHGAVEVIWDKETTWNVETDTTFSTEEGKPKEIVWQGNCIKRWDPYNTFFDARVQLADIPTKGEFVGKSEVMGRIALKQFMNSLPSVINAREAFESSGQGYTLSDQAATYYVPQLNVDAFINPEDQNTWNQVTNWEAFFAETGKRPTIDYKNNYLVSTLYCRILPSDFDIRIPNANTPQIFKLIIVNQRIPIYIERQTNAHNKLPVFFGSASENGLGYQANSFAGDSIVYQEIASALANSAIAARRRAVTDRVIYDPSRISEAQMNSPNPSAKIPVKPSAYGRPIADSVYQFPFNDNISSASLQEMQMVIQMGNILNGQNATRQGQFIKGNKTVPEFDAIMAGATSRDELTSILLESQVFTPIKETIKINTIQYQQPGQIYSQNNQELVKIDPVALRKATYTFKVTDGRNPKEKIAHTDVLQAAIQALGNSPLGAQYNLGPAFSYMMNLENVDLSPFEKPPEQVAYETAVAQWQQVAMAAAQKGVDIQQTAPMPKPADFGYVPATQNPDAEQPEA